MKKYVKSSFNFGAKMAKTHVKTTLPTPEAKRAQKLGNNFTDPIHASSGIFLFWKIRSSVVNSTCAASDVVASVYSFATIAVVADVSVSISN